MVTVDFNKLNIKKNYKILDIGCGSGRHTGACYCLKNITVIGIDLNINDCLFCLCGFLQSKCKLTNDKK